MNTATIESEVKWEVFLHHGEQYIAFGLKEVQAVSLQDEDGNELEIPETSKLIDWDCRIYTLNGDFLGRWDLRDFRRLPPGEFGENK